MRSNQNKRTLLPPSFQQEPSIKIKQRELQNEKIISRIKSKYRPLKDLKQPMFPYIKSVSLHHSPQMLAKNRNRDGLSDIKLETPDLYVLDQRHPLIERVNMYLKENRKSPQEDRKGKLSMQKYLTMLQNEKVRKVNDLDKLKQQIDIFSQQQQPYFISKNDQTEEKKQQEYSFEQSRLLNAKIRQKLNHRKMIGLFR